MFSRFSGFAKHMASAKLILSIFVCLVLLACFSGDPENVRSQSNFSQTPSPDSVLRENLNPSVLYGTIKYEDPAADGKMTVRSDVETSVVAETQGRGFKVKIPPQETVSEMDMLNCDGYIGTANVRFVGLNTTFPWEASLIANTLVSNIKERLEKCRHGSANPSFIFLVSPNPQNRKPYANIQPDRKTLIASIPFDWRNAAKLSKRSSKKDIEENILNWADADGDGAVDILRITSQGDTDGSFGYSRVIQNVGGTWRQIWQTPQKEYEQ